MRGGPGEVLRERSRTWPGRLADRAWPGHPRTWREVPRRLTPSLIEIARLTTGAVVAYLLTVTLTDGPLDLTGSLTALLVLQATSYATLRMAAVRIVAVVTGVLVAVGLTTWVGLTWWSLGLAIAASLLLAKVLRLGAQALETPISAMLILGVQGQEIAVETRILTTFIGAGVGVAFMLLFPPPVPVRQAGTAVGQVGWATARALESAAHSMARHPVVAATARTWLSEAEEVRVDIARGSREVTNVKDARAFNPRALATRSAEPVLRSGLDTLERTAYAVRSMFAVVAREAPRHDTPDDGYGDAVREAFSVVLATMAEAVDTFGRLVQAEVDGRPEEVERSLSESLDSLREAQAILTELMFVDARDEPSLWLLRGSVLGAVEHVLRQLDLEERRRVRERVARPAPVARLGALSESRIEDIRARRAGDRSGER